MALYYIETGVGCNLIEAKTKEQAYKKALKEVGTLNGVQLCQKATKENIAWVRAMQGGK